MTQDKLKPCPFCPSGGEPIIQIIGNDFSNKQKGAIVGCKECGFKKKILVIRYSIDWAIAQGVADWNTRTQPDTIKTNAGYESLKSARTEAYNSLGLLRKATKELCAKPDTIKGEERIVSKAIELCKLDYKEGCCSIVRGGTPDMIGKPLYEAYRAKAIEELSLSQPIENEELAVQEPIMISRAFDPMTKHLFEAPINAPEVSGDKTVHKINYIVTDRACPYCGDRLIHNQMGIECGTLKCNYVEGREAFEGSQITTIAQPQGGDKRTNDTLMIGLDKLRKQNEALREALLWARPYVARIRDTEAIDKALNLSANNEIKPNEGE